LAVADLQAELTALAFGWRHDVRAALLRAQALHLEATRLRAPQMTGWALLVQGSCLSQMRQFDAALAQFAQAQALLNTADDAVLLARLDCAASVPLLHQGRYVASLETLLRAVHRTGAPANHYARTVAAINAGVVQERRQNLRDALALQRTAMAEARRLLRAAPPAQRAEAHYLQAVAQMNTGSLLRQLDEPRRAWALHALAIRGFERLGEQVNLLNARSGLARLHLRLGQSHTGLAMLHDATQQARAWGLRTVEMQVLSAHALALAELGQWDALDRVAQALLALTAGNTEPMFIERAHRLLAQAAEGLGRWPEAAAHYRAAADVARGTAQAESSDAIHSALDALRHALQADPTPATAVRRASPPYPPVAEGVALTARQHQVLALICAGRHNEEIAVELGISAGTVRHHVSALLRSLGVRTRLEAALRAQALQVKAQARHPTAGGAFNLARDTTPQGTPTPPRKRP
jgi:DNA-binding CsgD family transcriptional regulator